MTYAYYHAVLKGKSPKCPPPTNPQKRNPNPRHPPAVLSVRCAGTSTRGEDLPTGFTCPVCGVSRENFKPRKPLSKFMCQVCGYVYEGEELPAGFTSAQSAAWAGRILNKSAGHIPKAVLEGRGNSMTKHRQLIHRIIQEADDHLTADQIYFLAKQEMPSIAIGTVYRNLNLMVKDEEIRRGSWLGNRTGFDRALLPHDHMLCQRCGKLLDVQLQGLLQKLEEGHRHPRSYPMI